MASSPDKAPSSDSKDHNDKLQQQVASLQSQLQQLNKQATSASTDHEKLLPLLEVQKGIHRSLAGALGTTEAVVRGLQIQLRTSLREAKSLKANGRQLTKGLESSKLTAEVFHGLLNEEHNKIDLTELDQLFLESSSRDTTVAAAQRDRLFHCAKELVEAMDKMWPFLSDAITLPVDQLREIISLTFRHIGCSLEEAEEVLQPVDDEDKDIAKAVSKMTVDDA